jgi:hypothetical protein
MPCDSRITQVGLLNVAQLVVNSLQNLREIGFRGDLMEFLVGRSVNSIVLLGVELSVKLLHVLLGELQTFGG